MEKSGLATGFLQLSLDWMSQHVVELIILLSIFVEISKVKINPISSIIKFIFRPIRKEIADLGEKIQNDMDKMKEELKEEINSIREDQEREKEAVEQLIYANEMSEINRITWSIMEFANSIENGQLHARDEYKRIKDEYKRLKAFAEKHDINADVEEEVEKIEKHYEENKNSTSIYF